MFNKHRIPFLKNHQELKKNGSIFRKGAAGVVGKNKFAYDIWGDTVNLASRMESSGEVGKVNISETTYELVKHKFACTFRGKIEAKNKGELAMYFVRKMF